jgi:rhodanese-related sulfurtransferase
MERERNDGTAATLRAALMIVIVGALLGAGFNYLGLRSHPAHGLAWIKQAPAKLPSLEDLQPAAPAESTGPASFVPGGSSSALMVLAVSVPRELLALRAATTTPAATSATPAKSKAKRKPVARPVSKPARPVAATPAPAAAAPAPAPAKVDLPVVPDMDTAIEVKTAFAKRFFDASGAVFVDAREPGQYAEGHIKGALSVPFEAAVANPDLLKPFRTVGKPIICYCDGGDCELSHDLAKNMLADGIRKVLVFTEGYPAWKAAGYPVEAGVPAKR